jgi:hypothetical protein
LFTKTESRVAKAVLALAISMLAACSDYQRNPTSPYPDPDPGPTTVDIDFCDGAQPQWVAFQDGDGVWTRAEPVIAGQVATFRHTFNSNRAAIATAREFSSGLTALTIQYAAPAELATTGEASPDLCGTQTDNTVEGTVAGIDTDEVAVVSSGHSTREATTVAEGRAFTLRHVAGPEELIATRLTRADDEVFLTGIILRHGPALPDGATIPVLDFDSPEAVPPVSRGVTLVGLGPEGAVSRNGIRTVHSDDVVLFGHPSATAALRPYRAVPEDRLAPGDVQFLSATTNMTNTSNVVRSVTSYFRVPTTRTLTFPEPPHAPTVSVASTTPTVRPRAHFDSQADYDRATGISYQQLQNTVVSVSMTPAYAAANAGGYVLAVPDLTGVPGFDRRWGLQPGNALMWKSTRIGGTLGISPNVRPVDGDTRTIGTDAGFLTP